MAFNLDTLDRDLHTDSLFSHEALLYCFQILFPIVTFILTVLCGICSKKAIDKYLERHVKDRNSWAAATAHAVISLTFMVIVFVLDMIALFIRDQTPDYYSTSYNDTLFHFPGLVIFPDLIAILLFTIFTSLIGYNMKQNEHKQSFLFLTLAGVTPLLCLASHASYIAIAWLTDTLFAAGIGLDYGIWYIFHLLVFKQIYKGVDTYTCNKNEKKAVKFNCIALCAVLGAWVVTVSSQVLISVFIATIPINNSTETTSRLFIILQSVGALVLVLIAYKFIANQKGMAILSGALRNLVKEQEPPIQRLYTKSYNWNELDDEEKLAVILHNHMCIGGGAGDSNGGCAGDSNGGCAGNSNGGGGNGNDDSAALIP